MICCDSLVLYLHDTTPNPSAELSSWWSFEPLVRQVQSTWHFCCFLAGWSSHQSKPLLFGRGEAKTSEIWHFVVPYSGVQSPPQHNIWVPILRRKVIEVAGIFSLSFNLKGGTSSNWFRLMWLTVNFLGVSKTCFSGIKTWKRSEQHEKVLPKESI